MMKLLTSTLAVFASLFLLTGCIEKGNMITVNPDGSGEILIRAAMNPEGGNALGGAFGGAPGGQAPQMPDPGEQAKKDVLKEGKKLGDAVVLKSEKPFKNKLGWPGYQAVYSFKDINKLKVPMSSIEEPGKEDLAVKETIGFKFTPGRLEIVPPPMKPAGDKAPQAEDPQAAAMMAMMAPMMKGMRMATIVKVNAEVTSNSADLPLGDSKNTFVLFDVQIDKVIADPAMMKKFEAMGDNPPEDSINLPAVKIQSPLRPVVVEFK